MKSEYPDELTYDKSEGRAILSSAPLRRETKLHPSHEGGWPEVLHNGEWWVLCRADLMGQVSSGIDSRVLFEGELEEVRRVYLGRIRLGVRLEKDEVEGLSFQCIDSLTDG